MKDVRETWLAGIKVRKILIPVLGFDAFEQTITL